MIAGKQILIQVSRNLNSCLQNLYKKFCSHILKVTFFNVSATDMIFVHIKPIASDTQSRDIKEKW